MSEFARPFEMALPSFTQHLQVLEEAGLVSSHARGRVRTVRIRPVRLGRAARWLAEQRGIRERRLDQLDEDLKTLEGPDDRLVFIDALGPGFRPKGEPVMTAIILLEPEGSGTRCTAIARHADREGNKKHEEMGFLDGRGAALDQLVELAKGWA